MIEVPPLLAVVLFIANLLIPSYFANKVFEVNIFRYIFYFLPLIFLYSWTLCIKSMFLGLFAAIMWKNYDSELVKRGPPQNAFLLRIIIDVSTTYLTFCLYFMLSNYRMYKDYRDLLRFVLIMKVSLNYGILLLFRPLSFYIQQFFDPKQFSYFDGLIKLGSKSFVVFHMTLYTLIEYYSLTNQKSFFIKVTDRNMTQLSQVAMIIIMGRVVAGFFTEVLKKLINSPNSYPLLLGMTTHLIATILLGRKFLANSYVKQYCFCCVDSNNIDLIVSSLLYSFGDACYSNYYLNINIDFTDQTSEALALVKTGQVLILSLFSFNQPLGYVLAFTVFYYLCTINIENE